MWDAYLTFFCYLLQKLEDGVWALYQFAVKKVTKLKKHVYLLQMAPHRRNYFQLHRNY